MNKFYEWLLTSFGVLCVLVIVMIIGTLFVMLCHEAALGEPLSMTVLVVIVVSMLGGAYIVGRK